MTNSGSDLLDGSLPPWLRDDDDIVYHHVRQHAIDTLKRLLTVRLKTLDIDNGITDDLVMQEIRQQMAEAAVSGHLARVSDLHDLAMDLLGAKEHARRL